MNMKKLEVRNTASTLAIELEQMRSLNIWKYIIDRVELNYDEWMHRTALSAVESFSENKGICKGIKLALDYLKDPLVKQYLRSEPGTTGVRPARADNRDTAPGDDNIE
jgi:hypothetical protein